MSLADNSFGPRHRVVDVADWHDVVTAFKADGHTWFDWLSAVDEGEDGLRLVVHLLRQDPWDHLLIATHLDATNPQVVSIVDLFAGAAWHERETHEMFGVDFVGHETAPLLLPDGFEGHPLRKEFVLATRVAKPWPGGKEPGESDAESAHAPSRRRVKPPGVPDGWLADE